MFTIIHCIDNMGLGGAQSMLFELYYAINKHYSNTYEQKVLVCNSRFANKSFSSSYNVPYLLCGNANKIAKEVLKHKNPIVFYHKLASSDIQIVQKIRNKSKKIPIIAINHTFFRSSHWNRVKCIDTIVSVSNHMHKKVKKWHPGIKKYEQVYNGVSQDRYDFISANNRSEKDTLITGRINRVCVWKHSDEWIKWCQNVKLPFKMVHEYIGGRQSVGSSRNNRNTAKRYKGGRNKVIMLGGIDDFKQKISILKSWDIFLYETIRPEGISMAILEALACGVPVICSDHFGNKEIIKDGINGYVFKDKKHAQKILTELCNDKKKLKELKKTTKKHFLENLDAKYTAKGYIKIVEDITGHKREKVEIVVPEKEVKTIEKEILSVDKKDKFTILSSAYNKGQYLKDWKDSILAQKYRPLEVVLANDLSTDNTSDIMKGMEQDFKNAGIEFKPINNEKRLHCGSSYRNLVEYATGDYMGVVDTDDMLMNDAVEYIMGVYKKNPNISWIYTQFDIYDATLRHRKRTGFNCLPKAGKSMLDMGKIGMHTYGHWRTFSSKIERPDKLFCKGLTCSVDKYMGYRLEEFGPGMFVNKVCYKYRQHPVGSKNSVSSTKYAMEQWKKVIKESYDRRKRYNYIPYPILKG